LFGKIENIASENHPPWLGLGVLLSLIFWAFYEGILGKEILFYKMKEKRLK
jgi:hypothetical protein